MVAKRHKITNVPLFKKIWDIIFFWGGQKLFEPFLGTGLDLFDPLNCPEQLRSGQFKGSNKPWPPQNVP
jgi:hypothetical protein